MQIHRLRSFTPGGPTVQRKLRTDACSQLSLVQLRQKVCWFLFTFPRLGNTQYSLPLASNASPEEVTRLSPALEQGRRRGFLSTLEKHNTGLSPAQALALHSALARKMPQLARFLSPEKRLALPVIPPPVSACPHPWHSTAISVVTSDRRVGSPRICQEASFSTQAPTQKQTCCMTKCIQSQHEARVLPPETRPATRPHTPAPRGRSPPTWETPE